MPKATSISNSVSIYIDLLRLLASLLVFAAHVRGLSMPYLPNNLLSHGREAVAVFFVLSGLVISYVVAEKETGWRSYLVARLARIMPVCLLAIGVTTVCDFIGHGANPASYGEFYAPESWLGLLRYLSFTNQLWFSHVTFGSDQPYWSLGFEIQYYVIFGLCAFVRSPWRWPVTAMWMLIVGPKILMYFPLWLLGVATYRALASGRFNSTKAGIAAMLLSPIPALVGKKLCDLSGHPATNMYMTWPPVTELYNFLYFSSIGVSIALSILAWNGLFGRMNVWPTTAQRAIRWFAGASFTLYLVHQPIIAMTTGFYRPDPANESMALGLSLAVFIVVLLLAEIAERRKRVYSDLFRGLVVGG